MPFARGSLKCRLVRHSMPPSNGTCRTMRAAHGFDAAMRLEREGLSGDNKGIGNQPVPVPNSPQ
jgi:hypothetical protein